MTISRGATWGRPLDDGAEVTGVGGDAALAAAARDGRLLRPVSGDVARTVGLHGAADRVATTRCPVDLGMAANAEGEQRSFAAHCVARRGWLAGPLVAAMNAQYIGSFDVAPRSHPNDGLLDIVDGTALTWRERWQARTRLAAGTHLPHPHIAVTRRAEAEFSFERPVDLWLDGVTWCRTIHLRLWLLPDAYEIAI